jgi:hypothetical protein
LLLRQRERVGIEGIGSARETSSLQASDTPKVAREHRDMGNRRL